MEQMSALDAEFLHLEDVVNHLHIGCCATFEGLAPDAAELHAFVASALDRIPRYRQRVHERPLQLGRPVWEDDPAFDLSNHLFRLDLPPPGDDRALQALMAEIMSTELERHRPLWELWLVTGLADDRWAMLAKVHHCVVDGVAGVELMAALLDDSPDAERPAAGPWTPAPGPTETALVTDAFGQLAAGTLRAGRWVFDAAAHPTDTVGRLWDLGAGARSWLGEAWPTPKSSLEGTVGPERTWTWATVPLADAKAVRAERGGTVNDVILAAVTRGLRDLLQARGEDPAATEVRTLVPVSVRAEHGRMDNEVSALVAELPVDVAVPELRYEAVRDETRWLKLSHEAEAGEAVTALADLVPPSALAYGTKVVAALLRRHPQGSITTVTTNVPGPQFPLYAAGRRMLAYHPFVPVAFGVRVAVAILSYDGTLSFGVTGDKETTPDVDVLAAGIVAGVEELRDRRAPCP